MEDEDELTKALACAAIMKGEGRLEIPLAMLQQHLNWSIFKDPDNHVMVIDAWEVTDDRVIALKPPKTKKPKSKRKRGRR